MSPNRDENKTNIWNHHLDTLVGGMFWGMTWTTKKTLQQLVAVSMVYFHPTFKRSRRKSRSTRPMPGWFGRIGTTNPSVLAIPHQTNKFEQLTKNIFQLPEKNTLRPLSLRIGNIPGNKKTAVKTLAAPVTFLSISRSWTKKNSSERLSNH